MLWTQAPLPALWPDNCERPDGSAGRGNITGTAERHRMGQMKAAGCFPNFRPVRWSDDPCDLGAHLPPLKAGAEHQADLKDYGPQPLGSRQRFPALPTHLRTASRRRIRGPLQ